ncbi:ribosomal protein S6 kinase beta-2 [Xenopus laevis]|uniref:Ribosomal protein S6 kinase beta-2 n=1 Tax=Xenopus laevis TaxID=8355 RepID=A0A8J1KJL7_XENLA|nr:ribosomal protein S6 kinase beta-2 [Xenopus laevis]XP_041416918.1 ribosomal protein S6 kinase beta-2 [Xenopus laevis]
MCFLGILIIFLIILLYRDLKPHNILLHNTGHAEIADFGLSADTRRSGGMAEGFCGTRAYIAPEVFQKCKYNKAVDYYSLGIILFQMATGMDPQYACYRNRFGFLKNVSPELQDLILKLLCENPNERMRFVASIRDHPFFANIVWSAIEAGRIPTPINLVSTNSG